MKQFIEFARVSQAVRRAAAKRGLRGDPFAECPPSAFHSASAELTAVEIYLNLPKAVRDIAPTAAMKMCRAVVFSFLTEGGE